jgi:hypothetical protein
MLGVTEEDRFSPFTSKLLMLNLGPTTYIPWLPAVYGEDSHLRQTRYCLIPEIVSQRTQCKVTAKNHRLALDYSISQNTRQIEPMDK